MAVRADDDVERDLDDDRRLDDPVAAEPLDGVGLEPGGHLGDLGVGQPAVGLADRDELVGRLVAHGERVVGQDAVALAVADLDADDDAVDRRQRLLHLQPAQAASTRRVGLVGSLTISPRCAGRGRSAKRASRSSIESTTRWESANPAVVGERQAQARAGGAARERQIEAAARPCAAPSPARAPSTSKATKMTGTSARIAADGAFRPSRDWSAMNGSTAPSAPGRISPSRMPSQGRSRAAATTSGNWPLMSCRSRRVEPDLVALAVELGADAVVLVLDPDGRPEPGHDLGGVLGRRGEHELERVEQRAARRLERIVAGEAAVRPMSPVSMPARFTASSGRSKAFAMAASRGPRGARCGGRRT